MQTLLSPNSPFASASSTSGGDGTLAASSALSTLRRRSVTSCCVLAAAQSRAPASPGVRRTVLFHFLALPLRHSGCCLAVRREHRRPQPRPARSSAGRRDRQLGLLLLAAPSATLPAPVGFVPAA